MVAMVSRHYYIVFVILIALTLSPFGATVGSQHASTLKTPSTWTIMVYMADNYVPGLPWQDNINQMEAANQSPGSNIVVLVHPLGSNDSMLLQIRTTTGRTVTQ